MKYYVSLFGDDSNVGTSETYPWRSIERVNAAQLLPGDSVRFHANQTFVGNLYLINKGVPFRGQAANFRFLWFR